MSNLIYYKENNIGVIKFNRPKVLNSVDTPTVDEFSNLLDEWSEDQDLRCVILTGEGRAFCCGGDINEEATKNVLSAYIFVRNGAMLLEKMERYSVPIIAAINGYCLGGGGEFALACDIRIAADNAQIGFPEINLGVYPGWGGTQRLPRVVGMSKAREMIFTGDKYSAEECLRIGLVDKVVKAEKLMDEAMELASKIASKPPLAIKYARTAIYDGIQCDLQRGLQIEAGLFAQLYCTEDMKEAYAAYLEKRPSRGYKGQ